MTYDPIPVETIGSLPFGEYLELVDSSQTGVIPGPMEFTAILGALALILGLTALTVAYFQDRREAAASGDSRGQITDTVTMAITITFGSLLMAGLPVLALSIGHENSQTITGRSLAAVEQEYGLAAGDLDVVNGTGREQTGSLVTFDQALVVDDLVLSPGQWGVELIEASEPVQDSGVHAADFRPVEAMRVVVIRDARMVDLREGLSQ